MKKIILLMLASATLFMTSCGVVLQGSKQSVSVTAQPPDADIYVDGKLAGKGSYSGKLKRKHSHTIEAKKDGYTDKTVTLTPTGRSVFLIADISWMLLGVGFIGLPVDLITGAYKTLDPAQPKKVNVAITLDKK